MRRLAGGLLLLLSAAVAMADDGPPATKLVLQPQKEPVPALRYRLQPGIEALQPGNAVLNYYRAFMPELIWHRRDKAVGEKIDQWRTMPLGELPVKDMAWLKSYAPLRECELGARRQQCDWDMVARLRAGGVNTLLSDIQGVRELGNLLALRARLHLAEGQFDDAVKTLQTTLTLARHEGSAPNLICGLVGISTATAAFNVIEEFIQLPEAPNLYWALTDLPPRIVDMKWCCQGERLMFQGTLPELKELEARPLNAAETARLLQQLGEIAEAIDGKKANAAAVLAAVAALYPDAKKTLLAQDFTAKQLEAYPAAQVVTIHGMREYRRLLDERLRWMGLPYPQAQAGLAEARRAFLADKSMMTKMIYPVLAGYDKVLLAQVRCERRLAALRAVEAIRLHAAHNGGKLPARLDAIQVVPVPNDPVFDKPVEYRAKDGYVELFGLTPPGLANDPTPLRYRIEMKK